ncbi:MAG: hypothetical protein IKS07_10755 [Lachnospiraceae bacterium]|nr:hypothetical protein [Lachnospiraceae bacterium]
MRKRKGYIFTNRKHPLPSIMSTILGAVSLLSLLGAILASYRMGGQVPGRFAAGGALAAVYALVGLLLALATLRKEDTYRLFGILGTVLCGLALFLCAFLLWIPT